MVRFYREIARINSGPGNKLNPLTGLPETEIFTQLVEEFPLSINH
jgi:hypothetical protein